MTTTCSTYELEPSVIAPTFMLYPGPSLHARDRELANCRNYNSGALQDEQPNSALPGARKLSGASLIMGSHRHRHLVQHRGAFTPENSGAAWHDGPAPAALETLCCEQHVARWPAHEACVTSTTYCAVSLVSLQEVSACCYIYAMLDIPFIPLQYP